MIWAAIDTYLRHTRTQAAFADSSITMHDTVSVAHHTCFDLLEGHWFDGVHAHDT